MKQTVVFIFVAVFCTNLLAAQAGGGVPYRADGSGEVQWPDSLYIPSELIDFEDAGRWSGKTGGVTLEKSLLYDQHTLPDKYDYKDARRTFQWDKIKNYLAVIEQLIGENGRWAVLENYKNEHDLAPLAEDSHRDEHNVMVDRYGVMRNQSVPVYTPGDRTEPERYGRDGSLVEILGHEDGWYKIENTNYGGRWDIPDEYVRPLDTRGFDKVVVVDRTNQNICTLEKSDGKWLVRSMNPATTGLHNPPYQYETPAGIFVLQDKKERMMYLRDGTNEIAGYAPYANRFTNGAYIHGVPVNNPNGAMVEFSQTLGTTPRSHMCVRTATSHAKFIYDNYPADQTLIVVID